MLQQSSGNQEILARERAVAHAAAARLEVAPDGTIRDAENTAPFVGWYSDELPRTSALALLPDRDAALFNEAIEAIRLTRCEVTGYFNMRHRNGETVPVVAPGEGRFDPDGALEGVAFTVRPT